MWQDVRFAIRTMRKSPSFTMVVVVVLALGIGANTTVFTLTNAVLFKALPFRDGHRILYVGANNLQKGENEIDVSYPDFQDWKAQTRKFQSLGGWNGAAINLSDKTGTPERYSGARLTANTFSLIGQQPVIGRDFSSADEKPGAPAVALIGYGIWKDRYGGDRAILGRSVRINEVPTVIIGVMPEGFRFPLNSDMWLPLVPTGDWAKRDYREMNAFGRLADGVRVEDARAEMEFIGQRLAKEYPKTNMGVGVFVRTFNEQFNGGPIRMLFSAMLGAVGFVLLIACANVANLLLSRGMMRSKEVSVRLALGASRWAIVRQMLVESVMLGLMGGVLGLGLAVAGVRAFDAAVANVGKPYWIQFTMDFTVFAYVGGVCVVTGILFGLAPALQASRIDVNTRLKEGGRSATRSGSRFLSSALVVTELALAIILLAGAGLMIRSLLKLYAMQSGVNAERMLTMRLNLVDAKYPTNEACFRFYERMMPLLKSTPGVEGVALASRPPMGGASRWKFTVEGAPPVEADKAPNIFSLVVSPEYFQVAGVKILRGRSFDATDGTPGHLSAIINQRFATQQWPGQDPVGKRVRRVDEKDQRWLTIVGVSADVRQTDPTRVEMDPLIYTSARQDALRSTSILVRTSVDPASLSSALRKQIQSLDEDLPVFGLQTMNEFFAQQRWAWRVFGSLFSIFALIALVLSSIGIYGVVSYAVNQRTREIGLRMALGAGAGSIVRLTLSHGVLQLAIGTVLGLAGAFGVTRVIRAILVQTDPADPVTFAAVCVVLLLAAVAAAWVPTRRAMKVDPIVALHYE